MQSTSTTATTAQPPAARAAISSWAAAMAALMAATLAFAVSLAVAIPAFAVARVAFTARWEVLAVACADFCATLAERSDAFTVWREFLIPALYALTAFFSFEAAFFSARLAGLSALAPETSWAWGNAENDGLPRKEGRGACSTVPLWGAAFSLSA